MQIEFTDEELKELEYIVNMQIIRVNSIFQALPNLANDKGLESLYKIQRKVEIMREECRNS